METVSIRINKIERGLNAAPVFVTILFEKIELSLSKGFENQKTQFRTILCPRIFKSTLSKGTIRSKLTTVIVH